MNKGGPRRGIVRVVVLIGGVLIAAAIIALYTPWLSLFDLREIVVTGNHQTSAEEVAQATGLVRGANLLTVPVRRVAERVSALPWVNAVSVKRDYPHRLIISVQERVPIGVLSLPGSPPSFWLIGEGGVVVQRLDGARPHLLTVSGVATNEQRVGAVVDRWVSNTLAAMVQKKVVKRGIQRIDFSDPNCVMLVGAGGAVIKLGSRDGIRQRIDALAALLDRIDLAKYRSVDLRFGGEATLVPRKVVNR